MCACVVFQVSHEWPYGSIAGTVENMGGDPSIRPYALQQSVLSPFQPAPTYDKPHTWSVAP